jgi:hypothetical protein
MVFTVMMITCFMTHLHLTIVVEVYNGTRIKQAMNLLSKTLNFGLMKSLGNKTKSEKTSCLKIFPMQESGQLILSKAEGDFLEQSELGFGIFFADGHTDKQMIPHSIQSKNCFMADLLATAGHIQFPT